MPKRLKWGMKELALHRRYDACVLYPAPLRDFLMRLALTDLFRARWSDLIHDEWIKTLLGSRPDLKREDLERTRDLMNTAVRDCLVSGFEHLIPSVVLPDRMIGMWWQSPSTAVQARS